MKTKSKKLKTWTTISSKIIHENKWFNVVWDKFITPARTVGNYFIINTSRTNKSILLIVVESGFIFFVKQYRYTTKIWTLEVPGGSMEKGFSILSSVKNELKEELGFEAEKIIKIGSFLPWGARSPELCSVFLATNLKKASRRLEDTEKGLKIIRIKIEKVYQMIDEGRIIDGVTLAALSLVRNRLLKNNK